MPPKCNLQPPAPQNSAYIWAKWMWLWVINATLIYYFFLSFCCCSLMNSSSKNVERTHFKCSFYDHDEIFAHKNQQLHRQQQQQPEKGRNSNERKVLAFIIVLTLPTILHLSRRGTWNSGKNDVLIHGHVKRIRCFHHHPSGMTDDWLAGWLAEATNAWANGDDDNNHTTSPSLQWARQCWWR